LHDYSWLTHVYSYLRSLYTYILSFVKRTQPLVDIDAQQQAAEEEFEKNWAEKEIAGWEDVNIDKPQSNGSETGIWCPACAFTVAYMYCFTNNVSGQKLYSKQTVYDAHLTSKKHVKATAKQKEAPSNQNGVAPAPVTHSLNHSTPNARTHTCARYTTLATKLLESLIPTLNETKSNVERRFSLTAREREQELLEQAKPQPTPVSTTDGAAEEEKEEERIYNPLKLPLGWDGKPIPYWLYKLHGLGVEYKCEICSDYVYMGR
jgi:splicing factor 3A subunit 3